MNEWIERWKRDKLSCLLVICYLLTVASSFCGSYLLRVELPVFGHWYAFRTLLPLTVLLYVLCAIRAKAFFWKDSTTLEKCCYAFIAILLVYGAASLPRALDLAWTVRKLFNFCYDLCFFFLLLRLCRVKELQRLTLWVCFVMWLAIMAMGIYEVFFGGIFDPQYNIYTSIYVFNDPFQFPVVFSENTNDYAMEIVFFYGVFMLAARREFPLPRGAAVFLTAVTYFLLMATDSRLCILAFYILLIGQIFCVLLSREKAARRAVVGMVLCVLAVQFCTQYKYTVPPIRTYLVELEEYEQAMEAYEALPPSAAQYISPPEKPVLKLGNPEKISLIEWFFRLNKNTGKLELRDDASAGVRAKLVLYSLQCLGESRGLGIGFGNTETSAARRGVIPIWKDFPQNSIHCFAARLVADCGIFALLPLCIIAFLLLKQTFKVLTSARKMQNRSLAADAFLLFAVLLMYPFVSTASSDAQDSCAMWIYLAMMVLFGTQLYERYPAAIKADDEKACSSGI